MASFKISAPGRIVLSGEHIAIYGKQFLATSLNLRTTLEFCELPNEPKSNIRIELPNINIEQDISLKEVKLFCSRPDAAAIISNPNDMHEYVQYMITVKKCMWTTSQQRFSLQIFFFLLYSIYYHEHLEIKPFGIKVSTDMEIAAGFGSSTSFAVCLAGCFLHWQRLQSGRHHTEFSDADLASIKRYTVACEKNMQELAFPDIDAHVCTYGEIVKCQRIDYKIYNIESTEMEEMDILLIDSNFRQDTYKHTKQMQKLNNNALDFNSILNRMELATVDMYNKLNSLSNIIRQVQLHQEPSADINSMRDQVTSCIANNQQLLKEYNLSAEKFDHICLIATKYKFAGKVAGFTSKYVYILLSPNHASIYVANFWLHLEMKNFSRPTKISINCKGVRIEN